MSSSSPGNDVCYEDDEDTSTSIEDDSEDEAEDEFNQFSRYRGTGKIPRIQNVQAYSMVCLHYFSDSLGLKFGPTFNEEVYRVDQIKEWAPPESKWLEPPDLVG